MVQEEGATSAMIADFLREMDAREMFESNEERLPFLLLGGHCSRAEFEFIECAN